MARIDAMEPLVHGRARRLDDDDELYHGVHTRLSNARMVEPVGGAAWTGIVSSVAIAALESRLVDAVVAVGARSSAPFERMEPRPLLCRTAADVRACSGVKPVLASSLALLEQVRADPSIKRLLFIGVGCQVQALRAVEAELGLERLYVLGTNCADNVRSPSALRRFMRAVSESPETAIGFEFMQDYSVHVKHVPPSASPSIFPPPPSPAGTRAPEPPADSLAAPLYERVPVFALPQSGLKRVIADSCNSCFDYSNALADLVVGYMAAPLAEGARMTESDQYLVVRNDRGEALLQALGERVQLTPVGSGGERRGFVPGIVEQDCDGLLSDGAPRLWAMPRWLGSLLARLLSRFGPRGAEFARSSIDYHTLRNIVHVRVTEGEARARECLPAHARTIEAAYGGLADGLVDKYRRARERSPELSARPPPMRREVDAD
jgi:7-hydroxymethyl chlorophyll a reductase